MNLTQLIRKLETQLKSAEKLAGQYDRQASALRNKLGNVARAVGQNIAARLSTSSGKKSRGRKRRGKLSAAGRAKIAAAQHKRWAAFHKSKGR